MTKNELKEEILAFIQLNECRKADIVRQFISKASPLTLTRKVDQLADEGKIVMHSETKKWRVKE